MISIELDKLSMADLSSLISAAMNEYQRRLSSPVVIKSAAPEQTVISPADIDRKHIESCLRLLKTGRVIRAEDVKEYRRIAAAFPEWMKMKRYPDDVRGAAARRYIDFNPF